MAAFRRMHATSLFAKGVVAVLCCLAVVLAQNETRCCWGLLELCVLRCQTLSNLFYLSLAQPNISITAGDTWTFNVLDGGFLEFEVDLQVCIHLYHIYASSRLTVWMSCSSCDKHKFPPDGWRIQERKEFDACVAIPTGRNAEWALSVACENIFETCELDVAVFLTIATKNDKPRDWDLAIVALAIGICGVAVLVVVVCLTCCQTDAEITQQLLKTIQEENTHE